MPENKATYTVTVPQFNQDEYAICQRRGHSCDNWVCITTYPATYEGYCKHCGTRIKLEPPQPSRIVEVPVYWNEVENK